MTSEQDNETVRRHRAASALLNERPDDSARATVLAAAARAVDAKPADAARRGAGWKRSGRPRYRMLSAAALLVVSVLTGLVAMQAYRERPDLMVARDLPSHPSAASTETPPASMSARPSPPPSTSAQADEARTRSTAPATAPSQGATQRASNKNATAAPVAPAAELRRAPRRDAAPIAPSRSERTTRLEHEALASTGPEGARPQVTRDRAPSPPAEASNGPGAAGVVREEAGVPQKTAPALKMNRGAVAQLALSPQDGEPATPEAWVARIVHLRAEHRDEEADRELARLRERFPAYVVPDGALRAASGR